MPSYLRTMQGRFDSSSYLSPAPRVQHKAKKKLKCAFQISHGTKGFPLFVKRALEHHSSRTWPLLVAYLADLNPHMEVLLNSGTTLQCFENESAVTCFVFSLLRQLQESLGPDIQPEGAFMCYTDNGPAKFMIVLLQIHLQSTVSTPQRERENRHSIQTVPICTSR